MYLICGVICAVILVIYALFVNWAGNQYNDYRNQAYSEFKRYWDEPERWVSVRPFWSFWYGQLSLAGAVVVVVSIGIVVYAFKDDSKKTVTCALIPLLIINPLMVGGAILSGTVLMESLVDGSFCKILFN